MVPYVQSMEFQEAPKVLSNAEINFINSPPEVAFLQQENQVPVRPEPILQNPLPEPPQALFLPPPILQRQPLPPPPTQLRLTPQNPVPPPPLQPPPQIIERYFIPVNPVVGVPPPSAPVRPPPRPPPPPFESDYIYHDEIQGFSPDFQSERLRRPEYIYHEEPLTTRRTTEASTLKVSEDTRVLSGAAFGTITLFILLLLFFCCGFLYLIFSNTPITASLIKQRIREFFRSPKDDAPPCQPDFTKNYGLLRGQTKRAVNSPESSEESIPLLHKSPPRGKSRQREERHIHFDNVDNVQSIQISFTEDDDDEDSDEDEEPADELTLFTKTASKAKTKRRGHPIYSTSTLTPPTTSGGSPSDEDESIVMYERYGLRPKEDLTPFGHHNLKRARKVNLPPESNQNYEEDERERGRSNSLQRSKGTASPRRPTPWVVPEYLLSPENSSIREKSVEIPNTGKSSTETRRASLGLPGAYSEGPGAKLETKPSPAAEQRRKSSEVYYHTHMRKW